MPRILQSLLAIGLSSMASLGVADGEHFRLRIDNLKHGRFDKAQLASADIDAACSGHNQSPPLTWLNAPADARSFVLILTNKDAARNTNASKNIDGVHWAVADIPGSIRQLPAGITADGAQLPGGTLQTRTDAGKPGYIGVCPPADRPNRYEFQLFALKVDRLEGIDADTPASEVAKLAEAQAIDTARLTIIDHQGVSYRTGTRLQR
ncbi:MAG: YbhB/YbcL family Raf kinase inhibitor-like protein [Lautropia sp.]|nr:YbhB/YbcL family Raf kinase inhibitor-like protein [Lautropia sp.]